MSKYKLQVGDTIRLKQRLEVGKIYDGFTFLNSMNYGFERLTVIQTHYSQNVELQGSDGETWWYPFAMLDFRTIRRKKNEN